MIRLTASTLELTAGDVATKIFWFQIGEFCLLPITVAGLAFAMEYAGLDAWVNLRTMTLFIFPTFDFMPGPIFGNLVLADEINRSPAKVQAALLEAMEERQVTVAGKTHPLPRLFLVLATQNPIEQEGTYPLPEAQMDRFLLYVHMPYPPAENEAAILRLVRSEKSGSSAEPPPKIPQDLIFAARKEVNAVYVAETAERYMVDLVIGTREPERHGGDLARWIRLGASPRATLALDVSARAHAWLRGQDFVSPDNIRAVAPACLAHRVHLSYEAEAAGKTRNDVIQTLLAQVAAV